MRPQHLRLQAFGAFPGTEVVDFDPLADLGLFVVTGPTGAGKTTLFDAMAFALYGELPADRPTAEVRSHHASALDRCEVELTFVVEGTSYRVRRTPEQERPKRRGTGTTTEAATAELHRLDADGTEVPLESGTRQVTEACVVLVGLDAGQFERVVLLPQGKFQQFLLAGTKERRPLLQKLFGTGLYRDAVEELKRRASELRRRVAEVDTEIDHHRRNAKQHLRAVLAGLADEELDGVEPDDDVELLEALWQKLAPAVAEVERGAARLATEAAESTRRAEASRVLAERWDQRAALLVRADGLREAAADVERWRAMVEAARRAGPVVAAAAVLEQARRTHERAHQAAAGSVEALGLALSSVGLGPDGPGSATDPDVADRALVAATAELERAVERVRQLAGARDELARTEAVAAQLDLQARDLADEQARTVELRTRLAESVVALEPRAARAEASSAEVATSADRLSRRRRLDLVRAEVERHRSAHTTAEAHLAEVLAAFVAGAAPRLAAALRPGSPCPVCGSEEHPAPAVPDTDAVVDVQALERAQHLTARAASELASSLAAVDEQLAVLGDAAEQQVDSLDEAHQVLLAAEKDAAAAADELADVRRRLDRGAAHHEELQARSTELAALRATATAAVVAATGRLAELTAEVGDADPEVLVERGHLIAAATRAVQGCREASAAAATASGAAEQAGSAFDDALRASGFSDLDEVRAASLSGPELHQLDQQVTFHDATAAEVQGGLAALEGVELPVERPDADALEASASVLRDEEARERARVERLLERATLAQAAIGDARRVEDAAAGLRDLRERTERVANLCDGQGPSRIGLETWVLAGELERVTEAANVHLGRMTSGRYRLERTDDAGHRGRQAGLDLTVHDSHTGRTRPPATLSGGEQFQASLALALGLADVVSLGGAGSGRRFEALFVDEGFGSLDPSALDQAVDALHQIHSSGRMVGVITHVEAMKQQLPAGIEVAPRADGRGSTLVAS